LILEFEVHRPRLSQLHKLVRSSLQTFPTPPVLKTTPLVPPMYSITPQVFRTCVGLLIPSMTLVRSRDSPGPATTSPVAAVTPAPYFGLKNGRNDTICTLGFQVFSLLHSSRLPHRLRFCQWRCRCTHRQNRLPHDQACLSPTLPTLFSISDSS